MRCVPQRGDDVVVLVFGQHQQGSGHAVFDLGRCGAVLVGVIPVGAGQVIGRDLVLVIPVPPAVDVGDEPLQFRRQGAGVAVLGKDQQRDIVLLGIDMQPVNVQVGHVAVVGDADLVRHVLGDIVGRSGTGPLDVVLQVVQPRILCAVQVVFEIQADQITRMEDERRAGQGDRGLVSGLHRLGGVGLGQAVSPDPDLSDRLAVHHGPGDVGLTEDHVQRAFQLSVDGRHARRIAQRRTVRRDAGGNAAADQQGRTEHHGWAETSNETVNSKETVNRGHADSPR